MDDATSTNPDTEILGALRPSLLTTRGPLIAISSPHARKGVLWDAYSRHFGVEGAPVLVAQGDSQSLNSTIPQEDIDAEYAKDPQWAAAEYGAQFRTDVQNFLASEAIEACIEVGCRERPFDRQFSYTAFTDPSGGMSDAFGLGIAHLEGSRPVLDLIRERQVPFSPEASVEEFVSLMRQYQIHTIRGDKYGGEWVAEAFRRRGINYEASDRNKSQLYLDLLPMINSRTVVLLDNDTMRRQLISLERRAVRGGKDSVDHPRGAHDDVANVVAGALVHAPASCGNPNFWQNIEYPPRGIV
jgi:hypothetical protein